MQPRNNLISSWTCLPYLSTNVNAQSQNSKCQSFHFPGTFISLKILSLYPAGLLRNEAGSESIASSNVIDALPSSDFSVLLTVCQGEFGDCSMRLSPWRPETGMVVILSSDSDRCPFKETDALLIDVNCKLLETRHCIFSNRVESGFRPLDAVPGQMVTPQHTRSKVSDTFYIWNIWTTYILLTSAMTFPAAASIVCHVSNASDDDGTAASAAMTSMA